MTCISISTLGSPPLLSSTLLSIEQDIGHQGAMGDDDYDPNQDDDVASDHLDDEAPGPSKRKTTAGGGKKGDVSSSLFP